MDVNFIERTRQHFLHYFGNAKIKVYPFLDRHISEVEKWVEKIAQNYPEADRWIILLSVWLHDIGQTIGKEEEDHAIKSEQEAKRFLGNLGLSDTLIEKVAHCVRSHRCKDVQPETIEAKILAAADSASHLTDINYIVHLSEHPEHPKEWILAKLERDIRDVALIPGLQESMRPLYEAWKNLIVVYPNRT